MTSVTLPDLALRLVLVNDSPPLGSAETATVWPEPDGAGVEAAGVEVLGDDDPELVDEVDELLELPHAASSSAAATAATAAERFWRLVVSIPATLWLVQARR
jgi:hypothetical protein